MYTQALLLTAFVAITEARFGQEQVPIPAIEALSSFGQSGQAATLAGNSIQFLLAAANPCGKVRPLHTLKASKILTTHSSPKQT